MIDVDLVIRNWLLTRTLLRAVLAPDRIIADTELPAGFTLAMAPVLLFSVRGGLQHYTSRVLMPSVQFQCIDETLAEARLLSRVLYSAINDGSGTGILSCRLEVMPQPFPTEAGWPRMLAYYAFMLSNPAAT